MALLKDIEGLLVGRNEYLVMTRQMELVGLYKRYSQWIQDYYKRGKYWRDQNRNTFAELAEKFEGQAFGQMYWENFVQRIIVIAVVYTVCTVAGADPLRDASALVVGGAAFWQMGAGYREATSIAIAEARSRGTRA